MSDAGERRIRDGFASLRREETAGVPPLAQMLAGRAPRRPRWRLTGVAWGGLAAAAVLVALAGHRLMESRVHARAAAEVARALGPFYGEWRSPTAALLETPGYEMLATIPALGPADSLIGSGPTTTGGRP